MYLRRMRACAVAVAVVALDQAAKFHVRGRFAHEGDGWVVLPGMLDVRYVRNTGAAWGVLSGFQIFLALFAVVMLVLLIRYRHVLLGAIALRWLVLGLLAGGIAGNLIDRVVFRYVTDFVDCHWGAAHFPAFNVADASICTGVGLYLLLGWLAERRRGPANRSAVGPG